MDASDPGLTQSSTGPCQNWYDRTQDNLPTHAQELTAGDGRSSPRLPDQLRAASLFENVQHVDLLGVLFARRSLSPQSPPDPNPAPTARSRLLLARGLAKSKDRSRASDRARTSPG